MFMTTRLLANINIYDGEKIHDAPLLTLTDRCIEMTLVFDNEENAKMFDESYFEIEYKKQQGEENAENKSK